MSNLRRTRRLDGGRMPNGFRLGSTIAFSGGRRSGFRSRAGGFFNAKRFHANGFDTRSFRSSSFCSRLRFSARLLGGCRDSGQLFRGGLHVGGFAATTNRLCFSSCRFGFRCGRRSCTTSTRGRRWRVFLLSACTLLAFPTGANACDLVVSEQAHVTANRNVHRPEKSLDFFDGHSEFVRQLAD
jgi:hypothetical protein